MTKQIPPKTYLLRWNPQISSFRIEDYREATSLYPDGFQMNWSVYEWENARKGDRYYMLRTGDELAGIVFMGEFLSDPYPGDDWAGKGQTRHYVDISCFDCSEPDAIAWVSIEELQMTMPDIDWLKGHSGELLTTDQANTLEHLWQINTKD